MSAHLWRIVGRLLLVGSLASCGNTAPNTSSWIPPSTFTQADLIGTWAGVNTISAPETLILNADHTFTQIYDQPPRLVPVETHGSWQVEARASGCISIHLDGMRNFHLTDSAATNGNRYPDGSSIAFWEPCEDTSMTLPDKMILIVGNLPTFPRGAVLLFPRKGAESEDTMMRFVEPTPTAATR